MGTEFYLGNRSKCVIAMEAGDYGTVNPATNWGWPGYVEEITMNHRYVMEGLTPMDNDTVTVAEYVAGLKEVGFTVKQKVQHLRMLALAMGKDTVTGSDPYTHTIEVAPTLPAIDIQAFNNHTSAPFGEQIVGGVCKKWDLGFPKGGYINLNTDWVGQDVSKITSVKPYQAANLAQKKYTQSQMKNHKSAFSKFYINGVDWSPYVTQATLSGENDLLVEPSEDNDIGELINEPIPQIRKFNASMTVKMKESTLWDLWEAGAAVSNCYFQAFRGTDFIKADFSGTMLQSANKPVQIGGGVVVQTLNMKIPDVVITEQNSIDQAYVVAEL